LPCAPPWQHITIPPLLALVTLSLLEAEPALLDCYFNLELRAEMLGREPDFRYPERLRQALQGPDAVMQAFLASQRGLVAASVLEQRLARTDWELKEAMEASELTHLQLHAAQKSAHESELEALRQRLEPQLVDLEQRLAGRDSELREARERSELSLLQLHHVQEELEHYFLADSEKQRLLEAGVRDLEELRLSMAAQQSAHESELEALRHRLEPQVVDLEQRLACMVSELRNVREEAQLTLLHLHQAQEELEHYFLKSRASDQLAQAQVEQLQRAQAIMVRLHPAVLPADPLPPSLAVEVLPEVAAAMPEATLQTKALLGTYAASLQRATALLNRARGG
jgi:hypothetical protein